MTGMTDVVVIGLGAMGAATLYQLAAQGARPLGLDRFTPPHDRGSSHGESRITRQAVGEGGAYAPLVLRSHILWRALEAATGATLLNACGGLIIGPVNRASSHHAKPDFLRQTVAVAERFAIAHEVLDPAAMRERFRQFTGLAPDDMACFEPGAGFLYPEACITAQLAEAARLGASIRTGVTVTGLEQTGGAVRLTTTDGPIQADRVIIAAGPWTAPLLGAPFDRLLSVTRQVLHWFPAEDPAAYQPGRFPVFIRMHGAGDQDYFYGFPIAAGAPGVKLASEQYTATTAADTNWHGVDATEAMAMHKTHIAGRLVGVSPRAARSVACVYTSTPDADFLIDAHPAMDRVTVVSACSGHGFKHSAAIGEAVAQTILAGRSEIDLAPFSLGRFR